MLDFSNNPTNQKQALWCKQLDKFAKANQRELAALAWGLLLEWGDSNNTLGIDLKPHPHFVVCSREAIDKLNENVNHQLQEILGILDHYQATEEVVIIGIGEGEIKLINFQPPLAPPECFAQLEMNLDSLIEVLEQKMALEIEPI